MSSPILLLHGALGSTEQLLPIKSLLEAQGKKVYTFNFSGHGGATPSPNGFGIEVFAEEILSFIDRQNFESVNIFGYSMGGYVAIYSALHHPEKIKSIVTLGTKFDWTKESSAQEIKKLQPEKIIEKVPAFAKALAEKHDPNDWKELMRKTADMMVRLGNQPPLTSLTLQTIKTPVHILVGEFDDMVNKQHSEEVAKLLQNASYQVLNESHHPIEKINLPLLDQLLSTFFM